VNKLQYDYALSMKNRSNFAIWWILCRYYCSSTQIAVCRTFRDNQNFVDFKTPSKTLPCLVMVKLLVFTTVLATIVACGFSLRSHSFNWPCLSFYITWKLKNLNMLTNALLLWFQHTTICVH